MFYLIISFKTSRNNNIYKFKHFCNYFNFLNRFKMKKTFSILNNFTQKRNHQLFISSNFDIFKKVKSNVITHLNKNKSKLYNEIVGTNNTNPYPFIISKQNIHEYKQIQEALYFAIKTIVLNYNHDSRIQETYNFSNEVKEILKICYDKPYKHIGAYR
jgi:hypothetical protein